MVSIINIIAILQYSNILQYAIYRYSLLAILYCIAVVNIAIYRYIVSPPIDSQVCFHKGLFSSLSNHERAPQGLWSHWMALIRMCVVPNCSQQLSRPILWIEAVCATYWTHITAVCRLMVALTCLWLPTHPCHPLIHTICDITVAVKKVAQKPAVLAS